MTAKRFTIGDRALQEVYGGCIPAILDGGIPCTQSQVLKLLNELHEENKELKQQLQSEHQMLENAILLERTRMGQNALKQYRDAIQ